MFHDPILQALAHRFRHWESQSERKSFERALREELEKPMGQFAQAWGQRRDELAALRQNTGAPQYTTPNGYVPDAEDGAAIDEVIATSSQQPTVPVPPAPQP